jgi:hypothetical protein
MPDNKIVPIMGPGCGNKDLEDCPPASHFELNHDELTQLIGNPTGTALRLKLKAGITSVHVSVPPDFQVTAGTTYCCIDCLTDSICCKAWPSSHPQ